MGRGFAVSCHVMSNFFFFAHELISDVLVLVLLFLYSITRNKGGKEVGEA